MPRLRHLISLGAVVLFAGPSLAPREASAKRQPAIQPGAPLTPPPPQAHGWTATAVRHRGHNGRVVGVNCPANGRLGNAFGTNVYTDDSSICTAAVHAGFITRARGGRVMIQIRPGRNTYPASTRFGVTTQRWAKWHGSFVVIAGVPNSANTAPRHNRITWHTSATKMRGNHGQRFSFHCPRNGRIGSVWGSGLYTDDSSICSAAAHSGVISRSHGGSVTIEIRPGANGYASTTSNGVTSRRWGKWTGSYVIVGGQVAVTRPRHNQVTWSTNATAHRGQHGKVITLHCPANGRPTGSVWGDGVYTDDSSVCTAAVHAGRINAITGGAVTIEIRPGQASYPGTRNNGVTSRRWAKWQGSFAFVP